MGRVDKRRLWGDFPDGPALKTLPSNAGYVSLKWGTGTKMPHALWAKKKNETENGSDVVAYSINTSKRILKKGEREMHMEINISVAFQRGLNECA